MSPWCLTGVSWTQLLSCNSVPVKPNRPPPPHYRPSPKKNPTLLLSESEIAIQTSPSGQRGIHNALFTPADFASHHQTALAETVYRVKHCLGSEPRPFRQRLSVLPTACAARAWCAGLGSRPRLRWSASALHRLPTPTPVRSSVWYLFLCTQKLSIVENVRDPHG